MILILNRIVLNVPLCTCKSALKISLLMNSIVLRACPSVDDNSIVFAITSDNGVKGVLVDAYGVYASNLNDVMIKKLSIRR